MSFPIGAIAYSGAGTVDEDVEFPSFRQVFRNKRLPRDAHRGQAAGTSSPRKSTSSSKKSDRSDSARWRPARKHQKSLSSKAFASNKRARAGSTPNPSLPPAATSSQTRLIGVDDRPSSGPEARALRSRPSDVFELPESSPRGRSATRPKHIPILIPDYAPLASQHTEARSGSFSTFLSSDSDSPSAPDAPVLPTFRPSPAAASQTLAGAARQKPRHVEIKIPRWAQPILKQPNIPPRLTLSHSVFVDPFRDVATLSPSDTSGGTPEPGRTRTMDSNSPPNLFYAEHSNSGSRSRLQSANSSHSNLFGMQAEYESASEAESSHEENGNGTHTPSQAADPSPAGGPATAQTTPSGSNPTNLSGLVCNVHRTTGKEPHALVGATTTVLGDKLYVFGGRRVSRTKPQLTSNIYELDLIHRHWTKLEVKGDIPPPRYFHTVCALGDTKLVCYGGMSPAPLPADAAPDAQPEVIVMSDIHIYDVPTRTWAKINCAESPQGRYAHCAAILPSSAVFAGANAPMSAIHHNPPGSNPNQGTLGVALDGTGGAEMVVVGGQDSANHYIEQVSVFNLRSLKWTGTTGMGRQCGAYRSVVTPLTTMSANQVGAGPHAKADLDDEDDEPTPIGSGAPMLIYSNYNFLDVKLELQMRLTDGTLTEKPMQTNVSPPGLRFPNGAVIDNHFIVSGTFLTSSKQEYALWTLDLRTLAWSRIDAGGNIFSQGSWNRGVLWARRNAFVILGNRKRNLVDDYNNRRINFSNICLVELEAFGLYDNPRRTEPTSAFVSASAALPQAVQDANAAGRQMSPAAEDLGVLSLNLRELADMDFLAIDGTRIPVNSRLVARRWGYHFISLLKESLIARDNDTATLRPTGAGHPSRNSSITITPSASSGSTTLTNNTMHSVEVPDNRTAPPQIRSRLFYLPHTAPTLHALLHYLYTSTLPSPPSPLATPQIFCSLLQLARPYRIDGLLEAVVERLHEMLDGRNAAAIFNAAAMGAGGGAGVQFASDHRDVRESTIPLRTASLAGMDGLLNGGSSRAASGLRVDTDVANGRSGRGARRLGGRDPAEDTDDEVPDSAATEGSMSESETDLSARSLTGRVDRDKEIWNGPVSSVVGLQKRGLRGLMEGRRMRDRGRSDGVDGHRVGLGIA